jgi:tetratricopeptide (TPR) repeat protein
MLRTTFIAVIAVCVLVHAQGSDALIDSAVTLYETRHFNSENLLQSYDILFDIVEGEPQNQRAHYELSKVCFLLGDVAAEKKAKLKLFEEGRDYGKKAMKLDDTSAWAHFWYMVNVGRIGQTKGVLNSLILVPEVEKEINKTLALDPEHTGALDAKAMLFYELPGLLGGNLNKSIEALNEGIALDSNYTLLYVDMGKVYMKKKDYEKARWFLKKAVDIQTPTYEADHVLDDKPEALELLEEIKDK